MYCMEFSTWTLTFVVEISRCLPHILPLYQIILLLPHAHAQGIKQSVCTSVVVVVGMKIATSRVLCICACYKHNQSVDIGEKIVCTRF